MKNNVKAIVVKNGYGLKNVTIETINIPVIRDNEVLVKVKAASLNQLDIMVAQGVFENRLPHILGSDAAGVIEQVGSNVTTLKVGDAVSTHFIQSWQSGMLKSEDLETRLGVGVQGVFAEYIVLPEKSLVKVPANLTFEEGATLSLAGLTAWNAIMNVARLKAGEIVLLQGTGGVSIFALKFAKAIGARVIILSGSDEKLVKAKELGADDVINYKTFTDWGKKIQELTGGKGVDVALEMAWTDISKTIEAMKLYGRITIVGLLGGEYTNLSALGIMLKTLSLAGVQVGSKTSFEEMNKAIELDNIRAVIDRSFPFSKFPEALAYFDKGKHFGKIVLTF
jgi:NADPH:quinone reductase-like Zn-dependent oxidoreductase